MKKREEILKNLHVAAKTSKWAVQALCVMQNLLQKLADNPIGVVSLDDLAWKVCTFFYKQLHIRPLEPQIFENRSNLASNCRASNRKFLATFEPPIGNS